MALVSLLNTLYTDPSLPEGAELAARIEEHELDLEQLLTLSLDDVKELGFAKLGPRKRALASLQQVLARCLSAGFRGAAATC